MKKTIQLQSTKTEELIDITKQVKSAVEESKVKNGLCNVYIPHATAAIVINENYDPSLCLDILEYLRKSIPDGRWRHDKIDNNASAHVENHPSWMRA